MIKTAMKLYNESTKAFRVVLLIIYDILAVIIASEAALWIRFDFSFTAIDAVFQTNMVRYLPINVVTTVAVLAIMQLYNSLWRYASVKELFSLAIACAFSSVAMGVGMSLMKLSIPRSYAVIYFVTFLVMATAGRFSYRFLRILWHQFYSAKRVKAPTRVMIVGAGDAGSMLLRELKESYRVNYQVMCIIDDNASKWGSYMRGVPVIGGRSEIQDAVEKYDVEEIIIAIPTLSVQSRKELANICKDTGRHVKILPGIYQIVRDEVSVSSLRDVQLEDLLGREPIVPEMKIIMNYVQDQVVLVTGGGGSIGSELCRQIAAHNPKQLIIFDIYENNAYDIQQELKRKYPELNLVTLIGSVRNTHRVEDVFSRYRPDLVYHAAAHKHVPLMEESPNEAIKNNVIGTYNVAVMASRYATKRFVLISTDKAVNPTNIMGASKRLCEKVIQSINEESDTEFVAVRFGNVLGSNGSVIPLFKKQIAEGGPVTVTHKDIVRYFMTIPEAVSLVLQAGAYAKGGEIFVLDMGEQVRIDDLARNLIQLSGYRPDVDIQIVYTGLRPGEKLYEEKLMESEGLQTTDNKLIFIGKPVEFDKKEFMQELMELKALAYEDDTSDAIYRKVKKMAPTFLWEPAEEAEEKVLQSV